MWLVSKALLSQFSQVDIGNQGPSDHHLSNLEWEVSDAEKPPQSWTFPWLLLKNAVFVKKLRVEWADYIHHNDVIDISPFLLWESGKAVLRGHAISLATAFKRQRLGKQESLRAQICLLEQHHRRWSS